MQQLKFLLEFPSIDENIQCEEAVSAAVFQEHAHMSLVRYRASRFWEIFLVYFLSW